MLSKEQKEKLKEIMERSKKRLEEATPEERQALLEQSAKAKELRF
jgi:hypothetical protein